VQGDWHFDADFWPDPTAMVQELAAMGTKVMVTVWPWSHNGSLSHATMLANGWLVQAIGGSSTPPPGDCPAGESCPDGLVTIPDVLHGNLVDVTNPAARDYVWSMVQDGYVKHGIEVFWLDSAEPEDFVYPQWGQVHWQNATFGNSTMGFAENATFAEMGQLFTLYWSQMFADGAAALGFPPVSLARASYAGTWRHGTALWSGDIHCSFEVLQTQVRTGLSAQTSGMGLWTTDIGAFTDDGPGSLKCDPANSTVSGSSGRVTPRCVAAASPCRQATHPPLSCPRLSSLSLHSFPRSTASCGSGGFNTEWCVRSSASTATATRRSGSMATRPKGSSPTSSAGAPR